MNTLVFDIETDGITASTVWCISILDPDDPDSGVYEFGPDRLREGVNMLRAADRLVAHNGITYDIPVLNEVLGAGLDVSKCVDTLVLSRLGNPERPAHSLEFWGQRLEHAKVAHDEWDRYSREMQTRCTQDVLLTVKVWERLSPMLEKMPKAVAIEMDVARVIHKMCRRGVCFDEKAAMRLLDQLLEERRQAYDKAQALMPWVYDPKGGPRALRVSPNRSHWARGQLDPGVEFQEVRRRQLKCTSRQDVARYLKSKYGWRPTQRTKTGRPKVDDEILRGLPWSECEPIADVFRLDKVLGYLNADKKSDDSGGGWLQHVTQEGRLHANFIPLTAVTGRPSCMAPNLQQVPRDKRVRALFGPRPGMVQVGVDADGQELRCLGHYLWPYDGGAYADEVVMGDIHSRVQEMIGFHTRDGTKPAEYGLIYGAGNAKLGLIALKDAMSVGKTIKGDLARRGSQIRKAIMQGIDGFEQLLEDVRLKASQAGKLRGLDGRTLWVRSPHSALNLLLQSAGIIHLKKAISMLEPAMAAAGLAEDKDWGLILWVHDEVQLEARPEVAEQVGAIAAQCVTDAAKELGFRVPMTGKYMVGSNWSETH